MKCLRKLQDGPFSQTLPDGPPSSLSFFTVLPDYQITRLRNPGLIRSLVWLMAPMFTCMWCKQCVSCPLITHEDTVVNGYLGLFLLLTDVLCIFYHFSQLVFVRLVDVRPEEVSLGVAYGGTYVRSLSLVSG